MFCATYGQILETRRWSPHRHFKQSSIPLLVWLAVHPPFLHLLETIRLFSAWQKMEGYFGVRLPGCDNALPWYPQLRYQFRSSLRTALYSTRKAIKTQMTSGSPATVLQSVMASQSVSQGSRFAWGNRQTKCQGWAGHNADNR